MKKIYLLLAFILATLLPENSYATDHSGIIASNQTWTKGNNPHIITGSVVVNAGVTLTISPGCIVKFKGLCVATHKPFYV